MSRVIRIQTDFASGEIDPLLRSRIDLKQYYQALQTAQNVFILPQGGAKRRDGLKYVAQLPSAAAPQDGVRCIPFEFNTSDSYMFVVVNQRIYIFKNAALVTNINGSGNDYLAVGAITSAMLSTLRHAQSADTIIFVHEDLAPLKIVRGATDASWTVSTITFTNVPRHAYTLTTSNPAADITPDATSDNVKITASAAVWHEGRTGTAQAGASSTITLDSGASATDDIYIGATITTTGGTGSGQTRIISDYVGSSKVATVSAAWSTTPASDTTFEIASQLGQYINNVDSFGRLRIIEFVSATVVKAYAETALFDTDAITSGNWELESGYEDAWSSDRGYPKSLTFHEGRLFFAGTKSLPTTFFGSVVNSFFDFDKGEGLDDQSVEATIVTESLNAIVDIFSGRDLQIFTTGGEFYVPQTTNEPITPGNLVVKTATRNGAKIGVPVVGLDSGTLFIQRSGKQLNEMLFTDVELSYTTSNISLLSGHLLKTPLDMAIRRATSTEEADRLFLVNGDDGTISCYSLLRAQQVVAPSSVVTDGEFQAVAVDVDTIYTVVKRNINSADVYYVEVFDRTLHTDSSVYSASASSTGSAAHLEGETLNVIVDGNVQADKTVASGSVTFDRASASNYEIGMPFSVSVQTMPLEPRLASGSVKGFKKRIIKVNAEVFETQAMTVNNQQVAFRQFGEDVLDSSVTPFTGVKTVGPLLGFVDEGTITVTQSVPLDMTVLALDYQLSVGQ
jgi:hypothetical protein